MHGLAEMFCVVVVMMAVAVWEMFGPPGDDDDTG